MTIGDGHDLTYIHWRGDEVLEAVYDNERLLRKGDRGPAVEKLQKALIYLDFSLPQFGADGIFGNETEHAVKKCQERFGLAVDGIVGPITIGRMDQRLSYPNPPI